MLAQYVNTDTITRLGKADRIDRRTNERTLEKGGEKKSDAHDQEPSRTAPQQRSGTLPTS